MNEPQRVMYSSVYRYGFLVIILGLLMNWLLWLWRLPAGYPYERYGNGIVVGMLLFNHLAFAFKWRPMIRIVAYVVAFAWLIFGFFYLLYWSKILFPAA